MNDTINKDSIIAELQCYVDLSLFDAFTGEVLVKQQLSEKNREVCTACEEAIKYISGASEGELDMPIEDISAIIGGITKGLETSIAERETFMNELGKEESHKVGLDRTNDEEIQTLKCFKAALDILADDTLDLTVKNGIRR